MRIAFTKAESSHEHRRRRPARGGDWARRRRRRARRGLRGDRAAHRRAPRARPVRRDEVHDGAARALLPSGDAARRRPHGHLGGALLLGARSAASSRAMADSRATPGPMRYAELREKLDALGRSLGGAYRVLVDANQHVDREAAARSGVGFYGKNTMLITRRHGSWVVLGTLVSDVELEADRAARRGLRRVPSLHRRLPDRRARRARDARRDEVPLVLAAGARVDPRAVPRRCSARRCTAATSARTSARGTAASASAATRRRRAPGTSTSSTGSRRTATRSSTTYDRLYVPRNEPRWLRRNALVALGNVGGSEHEPLLARFAADGDDIEREHARVGARTGPGARMRPQRPLEWWISVIRLGAVPFAHPPGVADRGHPVPRPSGRLGGDRPARRRRRPAVCAQPPRRCSCA